jgi:hypothetical protein
MTDYRVYILGDDNRITRRADLDCTTMALRSNTPSNSSTATILNCVRATAGSSGSID